MTGKLVSALISPLGTALLLGGLGWVLMFLNSARAGEGRPEGAEPAARRLQGTARALMGLAWLWLALWSLPVASDALRGWIEAQAGPRTVAVCPPLTVSAVQIDTFLGALDAVLAEAGEGIT